MNRLFGKNRSVLDIEKVFSFSQIPTKEQKSQLRDESNPSATEEEKEHELRTQKAFLDRLETIVKKYAEAHSGIDVTIAVPSDNDLNALIASAVAHHCHNPRY